MISLTAHIWHLKDGFLPDFNPSTNSCRLCLMEKYTIVYKVELTIINQTNEIFT